MPAGLESCCSKNILASPSRRQQSCHPGVQGMEVPKAGQEAVLAWLAAVAGANLPRVSGGEVVALSTKPPPFLETCHGHRSILLASLTNFV